MVVFGQNLGAAGPGLIPADGPGVRTTTLRDVPEGLPARPHRLDHHVVLLVTAGHGGQTVDFVAHPCRPGTLVWARPGQVVRYGRQPGLDATLVAWRPDLLAALEVDAPAVTDPFGPTHWQLTGEDEDAIINEVSQLVVDCDRYGGGRLPAELLRHQLAVLMLRIAALPARRPDGPPGDPQHRADRSAARGTAADTTFLRLRRAVERSYVETRRVEDYAARLGCSVRTLTRASLAATGRSAKQIIDDRAALEARRLLACTELQIAEIGQRLGFPEATNFGRFFHREVGCSPGAFRARALR
jgi:AraC-like DNA-binding protein